MVASYQFPPDSSRMRAVALVPWGAGGLMIPLWPKTPTVWRNSASGVLTSAAIAGLASTQGFAGAAADAASGAWMVQYAGSLVSYSSGGAASGFALPSGNVYLGCAFVPSFAQPYVTTSTGLLFAGSGAVAVAGSGFGRPVWGLATSGTTLFGLAYGGVSSYALSASASGASGFIAFPAGMASGMCLAASSPASAIAVGGWTYAALTTGYSAMAFSPAGPAMAALSSGGGLTNLYIGTNDVWSLVQSVTGAGAPSFAAWSPDGLRLLVSDPVSGTVRYYAYAFETLSLTQTLNISGAAAVSITSDGLRALVCQPGLNRITPLSLSGSSWVSGSPFAVASPQSVLAAGSGLAFAGCSSGLARLLFGTAWAVSGTLAVGFAPSSLAMGSGNILAAGTSGTSGFFVAATPALGLLFTTSWAGAACGLVDVQSQIVVNDPTNSLFWCYGNLFTQYQQIFVVPALRPLNGIAVSPYTPFSNGGTLFGMASGSAPMYQFTAPYNLEPLRNGAVAIRTSAGWVTAALGSGHIPTALVFDTSGNVRAATLQNELYQIGGVSGNVISSQTVTQFSGQPQSAPLGISAMAFLGSGLYGTSSLAGPLVRLL